jgi:hypothetical protein
MVLLDKKSLHKQQGQDIGKHLFNFIEYFELIWINCMQKVCYTVIWHMGVGSQIGIITADLGPYQNTVSGYATLVYIKQNF